MKLSRPAIGLMSLLAAMTACDDSTSMIGGSLVEDEAEIIIDSSFVASGHPLLDPPIMSRTISQLIGDIDARGYGRLSSEIVTQFMPSLNLDTTGVAPEDVDSVKMILFYDNASLVGDSLVPMGLTIYRLNRQLPSPIYSTFDPAGYYDPADVLASTVYTANTFHSDSLNKLSYRSVNITLPREFGVELYRRYYQSPETFVTPEAFAQWFPGVYIANSFGSGRVMNIYETRINLHYKRHGKVEKDGVERDTIINCATTYLAVTPEVVTNNDLRLTMSPELSSRIAAGENIIVAPAGSNVEVTLPMRDMIESYRKRGSQMNVFNSLALKIPVDTIENTYGIQPPAYLLLVLKNKRDEFFANNSLPDSRTSFYASYDATRLTYTFSSMRDYFVDMLEKEGELTDEDMTFDVIPVDVEWRVDQNTNQRYMVSMTPYITGPAMVSLNLDQSQIKMLYSRQNINR